MPSHARIALERPAPDEFDAFYASYIARVPTVSDAVRQLAAQGDDLARVLAAVPEAQAGFRYAAGKWSIREVLCHVCDAERVFAYRLLRIGRGDGTPLAGFDEDAYARAAEGDRRMQADVVDEWRSVRGATSSLVGGLPGAAWTRRGVANHKPVSGRALVYIILGHVEHHRHVFAERYGLALAGQL